MSAAHSLTFSRREPKADFDLLDALMGELEDDFDLDALMGELEAVQEEQTGNRLAERSCIEIMMKLMQRGDLDVLYTLDGREYLTPDQLVRELNAEIARHGGRVHLGEMQQVLNVDRFYIDAAAKTLLAEDVRGRSVGVAGGNGTGLELINEGTEIISDLFLDNLAREVSEYLEDAGSVSIGELATKQGFPVAFVEKMVNSRLASGTLQALRRHDKLYSEQFASDIERRILGALTAITRPTPLQSLVQRFDFLERSVVVDTAKKLCASGRVRGTVAGNDFLPDIFTRIQREACLGFFQSNGWMPKSRALQLKVTRLAPLLAETLGKEAVLDLPSCVIPTEAFERMQSYIEEVVTPSAPNAMVPPLSQQGAPWFHVPTILEPISLTSADVSALFVKLNRKDVAMEVDDMKRSSRAVLMDQSYVVSTRFLSECCNAFDELADAHAKEAVAVRLQMPAGKRAGVSPEGEVYHIVGDGAGGGGGGKGKAKGKNKRNKRGGRRAEDIESDDDSAIVTGGRKGKSNKKGKKKRGRRRGVVSSDEEEEDAPEAALSSKRSRREKRKAKKKKGGGGGGGGDDNASGDQNLVIRAGEIVTPEFLTRVIREKFSHLNVDPDGNEDGEENNCELVEAIVAHIGKHVRGTYIEAMQKALKSSNKSSAISVQAIASGLQERLLATHQQFVMDVKALDKFLAVIAKQAATSEANNDDDKERDEAHAVALELCQLISSNIIETHGLPIIGMLLGVQCPREAMAIVDDEEDDNAKIDKVLKCFSDIATARKTVNKIDDKEIKQAIASLINLAKNDIGGETASEFVQLVEPAAAACNMILRPLDKKSERNAVFHKTNTKSDELAATKDPVQGAVSAGVLLFSRLEGAFLEIPASCRPSQCVSLLIALKPLVSASLGRLLAASAGLLRDSEKEEGGGEEKDSLATGVLKSLQILSTTKRSQLKVLEVDGF